jgi:hypothetical protein
LSQSVSSAIVFNNISIDGKSPGVIVGKFRTNYIFCNGIARSGSTWSFNACRLLLQEAGCSDLSATFLQPDVLRVYLSQADPNRMHLIKTHNLIPEAARLTSEGKAVCISTIRFPPDAVASMMGFFKTPFGPAVKSIEHGLLQLMPFLDHPGMLLVDFADIVAEPPLAAVKKVAEYFNIVLEEAVLEQIAIKTSWENLKKYSDGLSQEKNVQLIQTPRSSYDPVTLLHVGHAPKGKERNFRNELSKEEQEIVIKVFRPWIARFWPEQI